MSYHPNGTGTGTPASQHPGKENPRNNNSSHNNNTSKNTGSGEWVDVSAAAAAAAVSNDNNNNHNSDHNRNSNKPPSPQNQQQQQQDFPSLDECLYGTTRRSPFIPEDGKGGDNDDSRSQSHSDSHSHSGDDSEQPHRQLDHNRHDIDVALLRKLCSQGGGIPDDDDNGDNDGDSADDGGQAAGTGTVSGVCHRGVAWRILLEQLPVGDIHATWPKVVPAQRALYNGMVKQYMEHANDPGRYLKDGCFGGRDGSGSRGGWDKGDDNRDNDDDPHEADTVAAAAAAVAAGISDDENDGAADSTRQQQQKQIIPSESDDESIASSMALQDSNTNDKNNDDDGNDQNNADNNDNNNNNNAEDSRSRSARWSDARYRRDSAHIRVTEDIYDIFPPRSKYRELWRQSGVSLNKGHSAAAIGMNQLRVPEELLRLEEDPETEADTSDTKSSGSCSGSDERNSDDNDNDNDADDKNDNDADDNHRDETVIADNPFVTRGDNDESSSSLSTSTDCKKDRLFQDYCKDAKLLEEIRKDVVRTHPHLRFYLEPKHNLGIRRHAAMERVLFVWAKLNGNLYVQGMNEIVGTIYYVLANDRSTSVVANSNGGDGSVRQHCWADHAEADTYYLFHTLMNTMDIRDVFVADLDHDATVGLHARIQKIELLLKQHDPEVHNHLKVNLGLNSSFYAIRWLTTLLSREFLLPDTIRLWDSMFASTHKENFLRYVCASMVMAIRDRLFRGDFGTCLKLLQNYPSGEIGMEELLESSRALWIYETQISLACKKGGLSLRQALKVLPPPPGIIMAFGKSGPGRLPSKSAKEAINTVGVNVRKTIRNVGAAAASNQRVSEMMGMAQRMWNSGWNSGSNHGKTGGNDSKNGVVSPASADGTDPTSKSNDNSCDDDADGWDIIDSIIDGTADLLLPGVARQALFDTTGRSRSPNRSRADAYSAIPTMSPDDLWNRVNETGDGYSNDSQSSSSSNSKTGRIGSRPNGRFWNRVRR